MKRLSNKLNKGRKGAPSGFVISLILHAAAFFLAGLLVVFTVLPKEESIFKVPPPVERPKMKLKKPKIKIKKSSQPKPSSRIVAKVKTAKMPEIQIPDLVGTGDGLLGGLGTGSEFMDVPEIDTVSLMGSEQSFGNDLVGTFYDFKRARDGHWIATDSDLNQDITSWLLKVNKFIKSGFNPATLKKYYRTHRRLYATCLVVPPTHSSIGPSNFDTPDSGGGFWMVHYKGDLVHKDGITFRFVCSADYFIVIRVDEEIVWAGVWNTPQRINDFSTLMGPLYSPRLETRGPFVGNDRVMAGEWITLEPGEAKDIDIIIGDENGSTGFAIAVEEEGMADEYEKSAQGQPIFPAFRTTELSRDLIDQIYKNLPEGELCLTNGPIFRDF